MHLLPTHDLSIRSPRQWQLETRAHPLSTLPVEQVFRLDENRIEMPVKNL